jgi:cellulose biosynthesis protein BcsQ
MYYRANILQSQQTENIVVHSGKGGSGKTTTAQNLATWLAAAGRKVALVDVDSYANSSNFINTVEWPSTRPLYTLSHVIQQKKPLLDVMYQVRRGLYIIPSDNNIEAAGHYLVANEMQEVMIDRYKALMAVLGPRPQEVPSHYQRSSLAPYHLPALQSVEDEEMWERPEYLDYIIWDFPGETGAVGRAILKIPHCRILSPVVLEPLPLQGFGQMKANLDLLFRNAPEAKPPIIGVIPYRLTHKREETVEEFVKLYAEHRDVVLRAVHEDTKVAPTQNVYPAQSIYEVERNSRAAREFFEIAMRIDGYTGQFVGSPSCKYCTEIDTWLQQEMATLEEGA